MNIISDRRAPRLQPYVRLLPCVPLLALAFACNSADSKAARNSAGEGAPRERVLTLSIEQQTTWVRNFNPFMPGKFRWPTVGPILEPMFIYSTAKETYVPWLATSYAWGEGNKSLRFTLRPGVEWSDGQAFTAADVLFTFELLKANPALDQNGLWEYLDGVSSPSDSEVVFSFRRPFSPALPFIAQHPILPKHVWSKVEEPTTFANENPVGTGPFTEVAVFRDQIFELSRNPHYWKKDELGVDRLRFPAISSNEQAILGLLKGDIDWAGNFIPDIERVYVSKDPEHHGYWNPLTGAPVFLYTNTTRKPFDDVRVRKALSMAIDRKQMVQVAVYDYTRPADATGLSDAYRQWRDSRIAEDAWVRRDVAEANRLLDEAGYPRGANGIRTRPDGTPLTYAINVVSGWSDWVRACQVMAKSFEEIGIQASVKPYDFGAWFDRLQGGDFDLSVSWSTDGVSPYFLYRDLMSKKTVKPIGEKAGTNWNRVGLATADSLFDAYEATTDLEAQKEIVRKLEQVFSENAPAIPLFPGPAWGVYNSKRFTGFPTADNPYAILSPNQKGSFQAEYMIVLLSLRAVNPS